MHSTGSSPTDLSVLPRKSELWKIVGVIPNFSAKRTFVDWAFKADLPPAKFSKTNFAPAMYHGPRAAGVSL